MKKYIFALFLTANYALAFDLKDEFFNVRYSSDIVYDNPSAKVKVVEYYSLTCHHCSHFFATSFQAIKKDYIDTGKVKWVKRSYAMDDAAIAGTKLLECVNEEKKESYVKILLAKQSNWAYHKNYIDILRNIAALGGLGVDAYNRCINNAHTEAEIRKRTNDAKVKLDITGTPTFFINGEKVKAFSEDSFRTALNKAIEEAK